MSVLTFKSEEYKTFPTFLREYASYVAMIKGNSEKTVCEYLLDIRTFFRYLKTKDSDCTHEEFEKVSIRELTVSDAESVTPQNIIDFLMFVGFERENNTTTRMRKLSALRSLFKYLHGKKHLITTDPTADIDAPKKNKTLPKYLSIDEARRLLETIKSDKDSKTVRRDFAIVTLFLNTGMRLSELVGLNLQSLSSDLSSLKVLGKGSKERIIYLNDASRAALSDYLKVRLDPKYIRTSTTALFLSSREVRISNKTVQWMVHRYISLAGLGNKGISVHKLRHTAATLMYQTGKVDIRVLKDILGHEQLNTTQIYTHVVDRNIEEAMNNNPLGDIKIKSAEE